jgi:flagellar biosynthesis/type III secretory pathway protein FliH
VTAAVLDMKRYTLAVGAKVIPADAWVPLTRAQALIDHANDTLAGLDREIAEERAKARELGHAEGRLAALEEFTSATAALHAAREQLGVQMRAQLTELAVAVVERIAPALGVERVVPQLASEAVRQLPLEPNLVVRVHPDVAEATRQRLASEGLALGAGGATFEVVGAPEFGAFDCVIETEGGVVRAGLNEQLEKIRIILASAQQDSAPIPSASTSEGGGDALE